MNNSYDIAVIGAGPAGATLARLLAGQYRVLLVDKRPLIGRSDGAGEQKCCGGLLAPDAQRELALLGLGVPRSCLVDPQLFLVRAVDLNTHIERSYRRYYLNIDREHFDRWLLSLVPESVEIRRSCRLLQISDEGERGFRLVLRDGDCDCEIRSRIVVGADGANSLVRRELFGKPLMRSYLAIQEKYPDTSAPPWFSAFFDSGITDFYAWSIPKDRQLLFGAALPAGRQAVAKFADLRRRIGDAGFLSGQSIQREAAMILRPASDRQRFASLPGLALIGEAGGWISPSSAEGISFALHTARLLAESLLPGLDDFSCRYRHSLKPLRRRLRVKDLKSEIIYHPVIRKQIMRFGLSSIKLIGHVDNWAGADK